MFGSKPAGSAGRSGDHHSPVTLLPQDTEPFSPLGPHEQPQPNQLRVSYADGVRGEANIVPCSALGVRMLCPWRYLAGKSRQLGTAQRRAGHPVGHSSLSHGLGGCRASSQGKPSPRESSPCGSCPSSLCPQTPTAGHWHLGLSTLVVSLVGLELPSACREDKSTLTVQSET